MAPMPFWWNASLVLLLVLLCCDSVKLATCFQVQKKTKTNPLRSFVLLPAAVVLPRTTIMSSSSRLFLSNTPRRPISSYYESLAERLPSSQVLDAVERAPNGRVVVSDVATTAGVSLSRAKQELTTLAALVRGTELAVTTDGDLIYTFPTSVSQALAQNSVKFQALQTFRKVWPALFWFIRVSFGVTLLASLVAIFSTIFFIQSSSSSSDDDRRRDSRGGGGGGFNMYFGPSPLDFFYYRPYGYYGYYGNNNAADRASPEEMGFLESCFSYIFGDGNPNAELEEKRLRLAAQMIRDRQGAVTAEQLAPFVQDAPAVTDHNNDDVESTTYVDESFVLPIVSQLGGEPTVTEDGEIVYIFPELQTSALSTTTTTYPSSAKSALSREALVLKRAGMNPNATIRDIVQVLNYNGISTRGAVEKSQLIDLLDKALPPPTPQEEEERLDRDTSLLQEREWRFSLAPDLNKYLAGGLGVVNLGGALWLGSLLAQYAEYGVRLPSYFGTVQALYPLLLGYALLFNVIPLARNLWIRAENEKIRTRNRRRRAWKVALEQAVMGNSRIARKIKAASKLKSRLRQIGANRNDVIFDTSVPIEEIQLQKDKEALKAFDEILGNDEGSFQ
jgi:hypothetical protein